jgi:flagellin
MLVRSAMPGAAGKLKFLGDEELLKALGLNTIQESRESEFTVAVYDAHNGNLINSPQKIAGNLICGAITDSVDVRFDPLAGIDVTWNEKAKRYEFKTAGGTYTTIVHLSDNTTVLQTGANEGEDLSVLFADVSSSALGLDGLLVISGDTAARSVTIIDSAIGRVSRLRAALGAYENRLEHSIANLTAASINTTAAESRIRDADMAKEMMELTKLNILWQSASVMIAQANQLSQSLLSLLK